MGNQINQEEINQLMAISGKARGAIFQTDAECIRSKKGETGLLAVKEELKKIGYQIDYENIRATDWYPVGLRVLSLIAIKKVFNLSDEEIKDMGNEAPKYSFIVKILMKYFLTFPLSYKEAPNYWKKHYTAGILEAPGYDLQVKSYIIRLKDFKIHPILCIYLGGYFMRIGQFVLKGNNFQVEETKCMFRGDPYHEYLIKWE